MSKGNRVLAAKNVKAKRERREFAHQEMTKACYLTSKVTLPLIDTAHITHVNGREVQTYATGMTYRKVLRQHF